MAAESQFEGYVVPLTLSVFITCRPLDQLERLKKEPIQKADPTEIEKLF